MKKLFISLALISGVAQGANLEVADFQINLISVEQSATSRFFSNFQTTQIDSSSGGKISLAKFYRPHDGIVQAKTTFGVPLLVNNEADSKALLMGTVSYLNKEEGSKYIIKEGVEVGAKFVAQNELSGGIGVSVDVGVSKLVSGGTLSEKPCTADYGELGSYQVGCRFASTTLTPAQSINASFNNVVRDPVVASVKIKWSF